MTGLTAIARALPPCASKLIRRYGNAFDRGYVLYQIQILGEAGVISKPKCRQDLKARTGRSLGFQCAPGCRHANSAWHSLVACSEHGWDGPAQDT